MSYQEQKDAIKDKVVGMVSDVGDHAADVVDTARREGAAAKRDVYGAANDIAGRAVDAINSVDTESVRKSLNNSLDAIGKSLRGQVRERPLGALAVAAAIGLVLGVMSNR
ncbi:MAG TPA: hypothetical protein VN715_16355 [Roseiarcus sp.]|nr:hypothetical protein [Roseiarcus sp.]